MGWLYVPGMPDLNSGSSLRLEMNTDVCVTSSGKPMQRPLLWRGWKTRSWIGRLSGTISRPLMADVGVDEWISSLGVIRANRSVSPAADLVSAIRVTCGPIYDALSEKYGRHSVFSRTSLSTLTMDLMPSAPTFENSDTEWKTIKASLRSDCLARRKWARRTGGNGYSSSLWPTATANDDNKSPEAHRAMKARMKGGPRNTITSLQVAAQDWQTPAAFSTRDSNVPGQTKLCIQAKEWATPNVPNGGRVNPVGTSETGMAPDGSKKQIGLENQAREWPTPNTGDGTRGRQEPDGKRDLLLDTESRDFAISHQGQETTELGQQCLEGVPSSPQRSQRRRLNPYFVEWLMGWPIGWTGCGVVETGSFLSWRRRHLCVLRRGLSDEVERLAQNSP